MTRQLPLSIRSSVYRTRKPRADRRTLMLIIAGLLAAVGVAIWAVS
jgi:hypothetical protein